MGSCGSSERGSHTRSNADVYNVPGNIPSKEPCSGRYDSAVENRAVHDGAILGIASAGVDEFVTCGEDKALCLHDHIDKEGGVFRHRVTFGGHTKAVSRAVYGGKTGLVYSCSRDTTIRQWDRSDASALRVFDGHELACTCLALSEDERTLCSGSRDASVRTWDVQTGSCTATAKVPRNLVTCLKFLSAAGGGDGNGGARSDSTCSSSVVVQGGEDLRVRVWDLRGAGLREALVIGGYTFFPLCVDVSEGRKEVLTSCKGFDGEGCETKLWDLRYTASPVREYTGHTQDTTACAFLAARVEGGGGRRDGGGGGRGRGEEGEGGGGDEDGGRRDDGDRRQPSSPLPSGSRGMVVTASKDESIKIYDRESGNLLIDHVEPESGGFTGLALQHEPSTGCPVLYAPTITGALYAFRVESGGGVDGVVGGLEARRAGKERGEGTSYDGGEGRSRLRCVGFVRGNPIL